jgi:hypothetical protein
MKTPKKGRQPKKNGRQPQKKMEDNLKKNARRTNQPN